MSYDLVILGKIENEQYICIDGDFNQGTIYNIADIFENIQRGITELEKRPEKYVQYEPANKWGTVSGALEVLKSLKECILEQDIDTKYLYMRW